MIIKKIFSLILICSCLLIGCGSSEDVNLVSPTADELNQTENNEPTAIIYLEEGEKYSDGTYQYEELIINGDEEKNE